MVATSCREGALVPGLAQVVPPGTELRAGTTPLSQAPIWWTYWPDIRESRDGTHIGLLVQAESNEVPSAAKRSRFGVRTCGVPGPSRSRGGVLGGQDHHDVRSLHSQAPYLRASQLTFYTSSSGDSAPTCRMRNPVGALLSI